MKTIHLDFHGFWWETSIKDMPDCPGIYCVYKYTPNSNEELIYIGQSGDSIRDRIRNHDKWGTWKSCFKDRQILCFSCAQIGPERERAEAALIFEYKPLYNDTYKDSFPFPDTTVIERRTIIGSILMNGRFKFTVCNTE